MNSIESFVITDGVLKEYVGQGGMVAIPEGVVVVGKYAFSDRSQIHSISFPETLKKIEQFAFYKCTGLDTVVLPQGLIEIGSYAFGECRNLKKVSIPDSVNYFGKGFLQSCYCDIYTNSWPSQLSKAINSLEIRGIHTEDISVIPTTYKRFAAIGFASEEEADKSSDRAKMHFKYIKRNAASLCETAIEYPKLLRLMCDNNLIEENVIDLYVSSAKKTNDGKLISVLRQYQNVLNQEKIHKAREKRTDSKEKAKKAVLARQANRAETGGIKGLTFVLSGRLTNQSYYYYEKLWKSRRELEEYLHYYGAELSNKVTSKTDYLVSCLMEPSKQKEETAKALGIPIISEDAFHNLIAKKYIRSETVIVPSWVKTIPRYAFYGIRPTSLLAGAKDTNNLRTLVLPEGLERIEKEAFCYCRKLEHVTIPSSVRIIEQGAFKSCESLHEVLIPNGIINLESDVFSDCSALEKIWIPESVERISSSALKNCPSVTIYTLIGSYAEQFAKENRIPIVTTDSIDDYSNR